MACSAGAAEPDRQSVREPGDRGSACARSRSASDAVETLLTERRGHATELARRRSGDAVFVFGGDGVVNEVLNGLPAGKPLGIVAGGYTNVLARALGVPEDPALRRPRAAHLARPRERAAVRVRRRDRRRLGGGAGARDDSAAQRRAAPRRPRLRAGGRPAPVPAATSRGWRSRGSGARRSLFVSNDAVFTLRGADPAALLARRAVRARARRRRAASAPARRRRSATCSPDPRGPRARRARRACSRSTTSTEVRVVCDGRCRSRRTARISAT